MSSRIRKYAIYGFILVFVIVSAVLFFEMVVKPRLQHARMEKAVADIRDAELCFMIMLNDDAGVLGINRFFEGAVMPWNHNVLPSMDQMKHAVSVYTQISYELLHMGRYASVTRVGPDIKQEVRKRLGSRYMDLGKDPWGNDYQFCFGPLRCPVNARPFRSFRGPSYVYDVTTYEEANRQGRRCPKPETDIPPARGFPCPLDPPVYIYSFGANGKSDQLPDGGNGGDDINNWDTEHGWESFYLTR